VPDRPIQRVPGDLHRPGRVPSGELAQSRPDIACAQEAQRPGTDGVQQRSQQALVQRARPLGRAVQFILEPVFDRLPHPVGTRRLDSGVHLLVQRLELIPDLLLSMAEDLAADPLPVGPVAERDRSDVPVLRCSELDGVLAATAAAGFVSDIQRA
jgi:hypothetical protein